MPVNWHVKHYIVHASRTIHFGGGEKVVWSRSWILKDWIDTPVLVLVGCRWWLGPASVTSRQMSGQEDNLARPLLEWPAGSPMPCMPGWFLLYCTYKWPQLCASVHVTCMHANTCIPSKHGLVWHCWHEHTFVCGWFLWRHGGAIVQPLCIIMYRYVSVCIVWTWILC